MACGTCGKGGGRKSVGVNSNQSNQTPSTSSGQMTMMEYIGKQSQRRRLKSKVNLNHTYTFSAEEKFFYAHAGDVEWLESMRSEFRVAKVVESTPDLVISNAPIVRSDMKVKSDLPLEVLNLDHITMSHLRKHFDTVSQVRLASDADLLAIKGFGPRRVTLVRGAISAI